MQLLPKQWFSKKESDFHGGFKKVDANIDANFEVYLDKTEFISVRDTDEMSKYKNIPTLALDPKTTLKAHEVITHQIA